ncbi:hypothetical protein SNE40_000793 [Patella caerulea]|uniref:Glycosyltransferase n=1 Tax=Patella caerulea TaxID=87958 RepID=A0AAN8QAF1_PATCE
MRTLQKYLLLISCIPLLIFYVFLARINNSTVTDVQKPEVTKETRSKYLQTKVIHTVKHSHKNRSCIIDEWTKYDKTARSLSRDIFCDEFAEQSDILCRWYLDQQNITDHKTCLLPQDGYKVPNIVYYITFGHYNFRMEFYFSILSAKKIQKPIAIYVIGNVPPLGKWWKKLLADVPDIKFIQRSMPKEISGSRVRWPAHASDIVRLQTLIANGGIYMDTDEVFIRPFEPLRNFPITMGLVDINTGMGNAVIVAQRNSTFLRALYKEYKSFNGSEYYANSLQAALRLWKENKTALHLEGDRFYRPSWYEDDQLYVQTGFNWRKTYAVHVWSKKNSHRIPGTIEEIDNWNTTLGEIFRYIYYDDSNLRSVVELKTKY